MVGIDGQFARRLEVHTYVPHSEIYMGHGRHVVLGCGLSDKCGYFHIRLYRFVLSYLLDVLNHPVPQFLVHLMVAVEGVAPFGVSRHGTYQRRFRPLVVQDADECLSGGVG